MPEEILGERFALHARLGSGSTATVWLADDALTGERVALKVVHEHLADDPSVRDRLARELRAASRIRHPHALLARELHELDGRLALTMPLHTGTSLADRVAADGPLAPDAVARLATQLAGALSAAHAVGVVHRDVTPTNVLIDGEDAVLVDFGLAHLDDRASRTATATAVGTWGYAAPEVLDGVRADPRSDLYGLGAVLYLAATGRPPHDAPTAAAVLRRQLAGDHVPTAEARPDMPAHVAATIDALLEQDPARRPPGARAVVDALSAGEGPDRPAVAPQRVAPAAEPPVGPYTLIIGERARDRRRAGLRKRKGPITADEDAAAERLLLRSVARHAQRQTPELPSEAMRRHEFKLLEAVPHDVAEAVFADALRAGFNPRIVNDPHVVRSSKRGQNTIALTSILIMAGIAFGTLSAVHDTWAMVMLSVLMGLVGVAGLVLANDQMRLRSALPGLAGLPAREPEPEPEPRDAPSGDPVLDVHRSAVAALDRLEAALADADLPAAALADLKRHAAGLRAAADRLAAPARHLAATAVDPAADDAAARIAAWMRRLEARRAAGEEVDADELARLGTALDAHRREAAAHDDAEHTRTLLAARLLEIGAAATAATRTLIGGVDLSRSAHDLVARLEAEAVLARAALDEVHDRLPREAPVINTPRKTQRDRQRER